MIVIDAIGQPCPIPVVKAKRAIAALPAQGGVVQVRVDNATACDNLAKMVKGSGHRSEMRQEADGIYAVTIFVGEREQDDPAAAPGTPSDAEKGPVVAVGADSMGRGSEELGKILIKGFIFSLSQLDTPPRAVLFFNSGVRLVLRGASTVEDLLSLAEKGCRILVCGTCVDYYQCKDQIAVGEVTNMYGIVEAMAAGDRVINI